MNCCKYNSDYYLCIGFETINKKQYLKCNKTTIPADFRIHTTEVTDLKRDEITTLGHRRGRPTTVSTTPIPRIIEESEVAVSRRPQGRRPVEIPVSEDPEEEERIEEAEEKLERGKGRRPETTRISDLEEGRLLLTRLLLNYKIQKSMPTEFCVQQVILV